jgi:16S rRNA (guanine966-N2)-methyltransferase
MSGSQSAGKLRIVAGELGGRRLSSPPGDVRPSAERTREAVFSMLGPLEGPALDLFCGSGALGIEALSRGAESVTLVDRDIATAARNVAELGIEDRCELIEAELPQALGSAGPLAGRTFSLILCDPPYRLAARFGPDLDRLLPPMLSRSGVLVLESAPDAPVELTLPLRTERHYGAALVRLHESRKAGEPA